MKTNQEILADVIALQTDIVSFANSVQAAFSGQASLSTLSNYQQKGMALAGCLAPEMLDPKMFTKKLQDAGDKANRDICSKAIVLTRLYRESSEGHYRIARGMREKPEVAAMFSTPERVQDTIAQAEMLGEAHKMAHNQWARSVQEYGFLLQEDSALTSKFEAAKKPRSISVEIAAEIGAGHLPMIVETERYIAEKYYEQMHILLLGMSNPKNAQMLGSVISVAMDIIGNLDKRFEGWINQFGGAAEDIERVRAHTSGGRKITLS